MFERAIEIAGNFTRPIFTILRKYGHKEIIPGSATIFFVNDDAWAVTTKAVAKVFLDASTIDKKYGEFSEERKVVPREKVDELANSYGYTNDTVAQLKVNFVGCVDIIKGVQCKLHPTLDLALVHFEGYERLGYSKSCVLLGQGSDAKPGKMLCRLGFPFPEFKNYFYDEEKDDIKWNKEGKANTPRFPLAGMVTRLVGGPEGIIGIELENPGIKGQEGGPVFDERGVVYGLYSGVSKYGLGMCIHVDRIKEFLKKENVSYKTDKAETLKEVKEDDSFLLADISEDTKLN